MSTIGRELGRARRDGVAVLLLPLLAWGLAGHFELSERLAAWFSGLEPWQADELPFTLLVLAAALAWYAFRRRTEALRALQAHAASEAHSAALAERNRELARGLIALQESERQALARELHDEVGQYCTALRLETAWLRRAGADDERGRRAAADRADAAAQSIHQLVRDLLRRLRPAQLDTLGLVPALQELCENWELRSGVACVFHHEGDPGGIDDAAAIAVYRVAQEALTNVMRHAAASRVRVRLHAGPAGGWTLAVEDDGVGLDPAARHRGLGLLGAAERAAALGGRLAVEGAPGQGVRLRLVLPAANEPAVAREAA
ncbi:MAG: sensor histidine kinase [Rubrivivax sp.]